jgi:LAO/AO transport system kinase
MTDFFLLLILPGAGDELQGMKRGIVEMIDAIAVNKADGDNLIRAERARAEYAAALHLFPLPPDGWTPRVLTCSALAGEAIADVWAVVIEHRRHLEQTGFLARRRSAQAVDWLNELIALGLRDAFRLHRGVAHRLPELDAAVTRGQATPFAAARELLALFRS